MLDTVFDNRSSEQFALELRDLAGRSIPHGLGDDRFDSSFVNLLSRPSERLVASVERGSDGKLQAYMGGVIAGDELHLDTLVDQSVPNPEVLLGQLLKSLWPALLQRLSPDAAGNRTSVWVWAKPSFVWHNRFAEASGLAPARSLNQMRAGLPVELQAIPTRAFVPERDTEALRQVNNRAFAHHPDQGHQSAEQFQARLSQPWVDPEGIRLFEIEGRLAGFCWTKIHHNPNLGEIYVIGIDPEFHGRGLGKPMTAAGLAWLHDQGLQTAMLYVEADNEPAMRTYIGLGFHTVRTDRSWKLPLTMAEVSVSSQQRAAGTLSVESDAND